MFGPEDTRKLSFRSYNVIITYRLFTSMQKFAILTRAYRLIVASQLFGFVVHWGDVGKATYLCLDCTKSMHINWNISVSFVIHVNFDHAWMEHYPVT